MYIFRILLCISFNAERSLQTLINPCILTSLQFGLTYASFFLSLSLSFFLSLFYSSMTHTHSSRNMFTYIWL